MNRILASLSFLLCSTLVTAAPQPVNALLRNVDIAQSSPQALVLDTRPRAQCTKRSIAGAHCLPATDLHGPHGELPNFADVYWALGTAGLDGSETVLVVGDTPQARDFVAGMLYLSGQARIEILATPVDVVLRKQLRPAAAGQPRAMLQQRIYQASMRDILLVLPAELSHMAHHKQHFIPIPANTATRAFFDLAPTTQANSKHTHSGATYVIYGPRPAQAVALLARLTARRPARNLRLRVLPVPQARLTAEAKRPGMYRTRSMYSTFHIKLPRGVNRWS